MRKIERFGVEMTPEQEMLFDKYLDKIDTPAPNTLTERERFNLAKDFIKGLKI